MDYPLYHPPPAQYQFAPPQRSWTRAEDKRFEDLLMACPDGTPGRWLLIGHAVGRSPEDVESHYWDLVKDLEMIESGLIGIPRYADDVADDGADANSSTVDAPPPGRRDERRRGIPWSEEEHRLFLEGLDKYGKGDWRNISRRSVRTRTPTQVASHAQKYFLRLEKAAAASAAGSRESTKRRSIHDITHPVSY